MKFPVRKQKRDHDCGEACFRALLAHFGRPVPDLRAAGWPSPIDGTDPRNFEAALRAAGLKVLAGECNTMILDGLVNEDVPVACLVRVDGGGFWVGHWVVVTELTRTDQGDRVRVMDPLVGFRWQDLDDFYDSWRDVNRSGAVYDRFALAVWGD